jgi:hypothetical protein
MFRHALNKQETVELAKDRFTAEEERRLTALRRQVEAHPECYSLEINVRRLEFAAWLVERGHLGDGVKQHARARGPQGSTREQEAGEPLARDKYARKGDAI